MSISIDSRVRRGMAWLDERDFRNPKKPFYSSIWCYRQFIGKVLADLKRNPVDIIHIHNFTQFVPMVRTALPAAKIILHMHAEWLAQFDRHMTRQRLREADSVIFCSDYFTQQASDAWPEFADRFGTVYNGVTLSEFDSVPPMDRDTTKKTILFAGRISPDKGVHVLVDAFHKIVQKYPAAELKIVGPWVMLPKSMCLTLNSEAIVRDLERFYNGRPFVDQLRERVAPAAKDNVQFTGTIHREELIRMMRATDVLVMPSIYPEGFGIPIVEAGACRVPSVITSRGGMPEVVEDGKTGLIVEPANAEALADAILKLLDNETLRQSMGDAAHQRVSQLFTWEQTTKSLLDNYHKTLVAPRNDYARSDCKRLD